MKNRSIELQLIKPVSGRSNMKGRITLKELQRELLTDLNVPFSDFCCTGEGVQPLGAPVRYSGGELQYLGLDGVWTAAGGGGGLRFGVEDGIAGEDRLFDITGFQFNMYGGTQALIGFDTIILGSATEGAMANFNWTAGNPIITLGDIGVWGNTSVLTIDDGTSSILFNTAADGTLFNVFGGGTFYAQLGNNGIGSGTNMYIDDSTRIFEVASTTSMLRLDGANKIFMFGNYDAQSGIFLDDGAGGEFMDIYSSAPGGTAYCDIYMDGNIGALTLDALAPGSGASVYINLGADNAVRLNGTGGIITSDPSTPTSAGHWKLGKLVTAAVAADATRYLEVWVEGVVYKVIISS